MALAAMWSLASRSVASCCAAGTMCAWQSPPDLVTFAEAAGLPTVPYGPDTAVWSDAHRDFWIRFFGNFWKIRELANLWREMREIGSPSSSSGRRSLRR